MSAYNRALFSAVVSIVACNYVIAEGGYYARNQGSIRSGRSDSISRSRSSSDCSTIVDRYQPDPSQYEHLLLDDEPMLKQFKHNHAIFDTLSGTSRIEVYEIYKHKTKQEIYCIIKFGNALNGYPKTVHGGISALMIDNSYGCLFFSLRLPPAFTANLTLNYRKPIKESSVSLLRASVKEVQGRKLYLEATLHDADSGALQVESTSLFVTMRPMDQWKLWLANYLPFLRG